MKTIFRPTFFVVLVAVIGLLVFWYMGHGHDAGPARTESGGVSFAVEGASEPGGDLRLTWAAVAGAESYDVVFLDQGLHEIARVAGVKSASFVLGPATRPAGIASHATVLVQIVPKRGGQPLGPTSTATPVLVP